MQLELIEGPSSFLASMLAEGKLDVAVLFDQAGSGGLTLEPVLVEPLLFVGASGTLAGQRDMMLSAAATYPLVLLSRPNGIREAVEHGWMQLGVKPSLLAEINSPGLLVRAVQDGLGFSVLPSCGIEQALQLGHLDAVSLEHDSLTRTVQLGTSRLYPPFSAADAVIHILRRLMLAAVDDERWFATRIDLAASQELKDT